MKFILFFLLMAVPFHVFSQDSVEESFTFGTRSSYFGEHDLYDNAMNFFHLNYRDERYFDSGTIKTSLEFRIFDPTSSDEDVFIDPVNASLEFLLNSVSLQAGFFRYRFSETFGLQILDVANPRDYSDYVLNDLSWAKRSVFGLNMQNRWDRLEILWMLTLWSNGDRLPYKGSPFDLTGGEFGYEGGVVHRPWFQDQEYGVRLKYLFENGLDVSVLGYHHFARPTYIYLNQTGPMSFDATLSSRMVDSLGMAASFVLGDWVLRGDFLLTLLDNFQTAPLEFSTEDHYQQLLGIDRIWENWSLGAQIQNDFLYNRNFFGIKIENSFFDFWKPGAMAFVSDKNADKWIQFKNAFQYENWNLNVVVDLLDGDVSSQGLFGLYRDNDRVLVEISMTH